MYLYLLPFLYFNGSSRGYCWWHSWSRCPDRCCCMSDMLHRVSELWFAHLLRPSNHKIQNDLSMRGNHYPGNTTIIEYCQTTASRGIITETHTHSMPMKNNSRLAINYVFIQGAYQTARALVHFYLPVSLKYKIRVDYDEKIR